MNQTINTFINAKAGTQVKGKTFENLLNEICQIKYLLSQANDIIEKVYSYIMNSIQI